MFFLIFFFFFSSRRRHTRSLRDWSSDVCSSDLIAHLLVRSDCYHKSAVKGGVRGGAQAAQAPQQVTWLRLQPQHRSVKAWTAHRKPQHCAQNVRSQPRRTTSAPIASCCDLTCSVKL